MVASLSRLVPALLRHLDAYSDIAEEDAKDAASSLGACLLAALSAAGLAFLSVLMLCAWLMVLTWDQPWRVWVPVGLAAFFALAAVGCLIPYRRRRPGKSTFFPRVRRELQRDRALMERAMQAPPATDAG
jgi:uncharacterized membrane protein YqjE